MNLSYPWASVGGRIGRLAKQGSQRFSIGLDESLFCVITLVYNDVLSLYHNRLLNGQMCNHECWSHGPR